MPKMSLSSLNRATLCDGSSLGTIPQNWVLTRRFTTNQTETEDSLESSGQIEAPRVVLSLFMHLIERAPS